MGQGERPSMVDPIEAVFPGLQGKPYQLTSPAAREYNCIAWAANDTTRWWWPDLDPENDAVYWPENAPLAETVEAFIAVFTNFGFILCLSEKFETGFEKVALFTKDGNPTHAARQLPSGRWTSKLGFREDIEHEWHALSGDVCGNVALILRRPQH